MFNINSLLRKSYSKLVAIFFILSTQSFVYADNKEFCFEFDDIMSFYAMCKIYEDVVEMFDTPELKKYSDAAKRIGADKSCEKIYKILEPYAND